MQLALHSILLFRILSESILCEAYLIHPIYTNRGEKVDMINHHKYGTFGLFSPNASSIPLQGYPAYLQAAVA